MIGIVIGIVYANSLSKFQPESWDSGIIFASKKILRFAIVFMDLDSQLLEIISVGFEGLLISLLWLCSSIYYRNLHWKKDD